MNHTTQMPNGQEAIGAAGAGPAKGPGEIAVDFLQWLDPDGSHNLVALDPEGGHGPEGKTFRPGQLNEIRAWVDERAGTKNLYYTLNEVGADCADKKPSKGDIRHLRALCVDVDPQEGEDLGAARSAICRRLESFGSPRFSAVVDSGGGYQGLIVLAEKIAATPENIEWAEAYGRGLGQEVRGDAVQNVDRILRLPGPDNIPGAAKRAKGREKRQARVVSRGGVRVTPEEIDRTITPRPAPGGADEDEAVQKAIEEIEYSGFDCCTSFAELPEELKTRFDRALKENASLASLWIDGELKSDDKSGSSYRAALSGALKRLGGYSAEDFAHLAYVWDWAVKRGDDRDSKLTPRALARDWVRIHPAKDPRDMDPSEFFTPIEPSEPGQDVATGAHAQRPRLLKTLSLSEAADAALTQSVTPLVRDLLDLGAMSVVYGPSNVGKTFVVVDMAFHIAAGMAWAGHRTTKSKVLYIAAEGGRGILKRLAALRQRYPGKAEENFYLMPESVDLRTAKDDTQAVIHTAANLGGDFGLIVVDTLSRALAGGDENGPVDMGAFVSRADAIRSATGAHLLVVHHSGKDIAKGARGHSSLRAATDTEIELKAGGPNGVLEVTKQRDLERGPGLAFKITGTTIGLDAEGEPVKSATVSIKPLSAPSAKPLTPTEKRVLDALERCAARPEGSARTSTAEVASEMSTEGKKYTPGAARKHLERLADRGLISALGGGKWAVRTECHGMSRCPDSTPPASMDWTAGQEVDKITQEEIFG